MRLSQVVRELALASTAMRLSQVVRELALASTRARHPGADDQELRVRLTVRLYGHDGGRRLFGHVPADAA
ncbi:hypothetical protein BE08_23205 [Sorangium cellulosum]|uniref:Uncharacterized protein n=1 Tax=Sorangium cellulosum TaxID=56 RepID=A0A150NYS1_SORCE|nr:hypothetical protein BE08_23205 [Sorangium cellulosum]